MPTSISLLLLACDLTRSYHGHFTNSLVIATSVTEGVSKLMIGRIGPRFLRGGCFHAIIPDQWRHCAPSSGVAERTPAPHGPALPVVPSRQNDRPSASRSNGECRGKFAPQQSGAVARS